MKTLSGATLEIALVSSRLALSKCCSAGPTWTAGGGSEIQLVYQAQHKFGKETIHAANEKFLRRLGDLV